MPILIKQAQAPSIFGLVDPNAREMPNMQTLYVDNHVLAHEDNLPMLANLCAPNTGLRLVVSQWLLVEIANFGDKIGAIKRCEFLDSLKPLWMIERMHIQRHEVRRFLWINYFKSDAEPFSAFSEYLSVILSYDQGSSVPLGYTARKWLEDTCVTDVNEEKKRVVFALKTLQGADPKKKKSIEVDIFQEWVLHKIPEYDPEGRPMAKAARQELLGFCYANQKDFYSMCPAMALEDRLCEVRARDPNRVPKESDAIDLQHAVAALSYCDFFITGDRCALFNIEQVARELKSIKTAKTFKTLQALAASLLGLDMEGLTGGEVVNLRPASACALPVLARP
ncbi:MAG: hypothetical protein ACLP7A_12620 [Desulfobaccales bacterium]